MRAIIFRVRDLVRTFWRVPYRHFEGTRIGVFGARYGARFAGVRLPATVH